MSNTAPALTQWALTCFGRNPARRKKLLYLPIALNRFWDNKEDGGFRGVQSKSLVDIIQLECLSHSSSVLKITKAGEQGNIWVNNGKVIDAATLTMGGEEAFKEILVLEDGKF